MSSPPRKRVKIDLPTFSDLFLTDRFRPIHTAFARCLSTADLLQLAGTCHFARDAIYKSQWNINSKLRAFLGDPIAFRSRLAQCNALISGSFALQFLERVVWPESDMDIFVEDGPGFRSLCDYLTNEEGYNREKDRGRIDYIDIDLNVIATFTRSNRKIQVIAADGPPIWMILRSFYTTAVMNVITWNKAFAVFPRTTFLHHDAYPLTRLTEYYAQLHAKYTRRGWAMRTLPASSDSALELSCYRRVGDRKAWQITLDTQSVVPAAQPDYVIEYSQFQVETRSADRQYTWGDFERAAAYQITASIWRSNVLRYKYTYVPTACMDEVGGRLDRSTLAQLYALDGSQRTRLIGNQIPDNIVARYLKIEKPDGWEYLDEEYVRCIDRYESERS